MKRISNEKLSIQRMRICGRKVTAKSDEETERLLMDIKKVWDRNVSLEVLKFVFNEWQNRYDSERINQLCAELLENGTYDKEWISYWKRWMTAVDIPWTVSGTAYAHCLYNHEIYDDWLLKNRINKNSRLGNEIRGLYYCFCPSGDFDCSGDELLGYARSMNERQRERLLINIYRRYIELEDTGQQEDFKIRYNNVITYLIPYVRNDENRNMIGQAFEAMQFN